MVREGCQADRDPVLPEFTSCSEASWGIDEIDGLDELGEGFEPGVGGIGYFSVRRISGSRTLRRLVRIMHGRALGSGV